MLAAKVIYCVLLPALMVCPATPIGHSSGQDFDLDNSPRDTKEDGCYATQFENHWLICETASWFAVRDSAADPSSSITIVSASHGSGSHHWSICTRQWAINCNTGRELVEQITKFQPSERVRVRYEPIQLC